MNTWSVIDKKQCPEDFEGIVYHNETTSNFSVKIASILQSQNAEIIPVFKCVISSPFLCVYFENFLIIFANERCENEIFSKNFESKIGNLIFTSNSSKLILLLENGSLHTFDVHSKKYQQSDSPVIDKFTTITIQEKTPQVFILICNSCKYYELYIPESETCNDGSLQHKVSVLSHDDVEEKFLFENDILRKGLVKMYQSTLCINVIQESDNNIVCPITGQSISYNQTCNIKSVKAFEDSTKFLYLQEGLEESYKLGIGDFSSRNSEFNIDVSKKCSIVGGMDLSAWYIDVRDNKVYLYHIQQNSPLSQLEILIASRKYEEAEKFAKLNNLSPVAVLEIKAKFLLNSLKEKFDSENVKELQDILLECNNPTFLVTCCIKAVEGNVDVGELLIFAKKNAEKLPEDSLKSKLDDLLWRIDVFKLLKYEECFASMSWIRFINEDPLFLCMSLLGENQLDQACIIWVKCYPFIKHILDSDTIFDILNSVTIEAKMSSLLRWLEYFIPGVICILPYSADIIINWVQNRICLLETHSKHWPEIGIQLAEKFSVLFFNVKVTVSFIPPAVENFNFLVYSLKNIQDLKNLYNIIVSLRDFMTLTPLEISKLILRKAFTEDLRALLSEFLDKFVARHTINYNTLIKEHIEELVNISPAIDEDKMEILLDHIWNTEVKLHCVLLVLKSARIPWTSSIRKICDKALVLQHDSTSKIRMEMIHAGVKTVLVKYECPELFSDDYEYLIRHIVRRGDSEMMSDIDTVTGVYTALKNDAYILCIQKYLETNEVHCALKIFEGMKMDVKLFCSRSLVLKLENILENCEGVTNLESNYLDFLKSINLVDATTIQFLGNIHILKYKYKLQISLSDYCIENYRKYAFTNWCKEQLYCNHGIEKLKDLLWQALNVGKYLKFSKSDIIEILYKELNTDQQIFVGKTILSDKVIIFDKSIESVKVIASTFSLMVDIPDSLVLKNALEHVVSVLEICNSKCLSYCINVSSWLNILYLSHNNTKEILSTWKISSFYNPHVISSIMPVWQTYFEKIDFSSDKFPLCICKENHCKDGSTCLQALLTKLQVQQNDIYFSRVLAYHTIMALQKNYIIPVWFVEVSDQMIKTLISKAIISERTDHLLITMLLFSHSSPAELLDEILNGSYDGHRKINISKYMLKCKGIFHHMQIPYKQAFSIYSQNSIAAKLESYGILYKDHHQDTTNVGCLLESLVNIESFNILTLEEFCMVTRTSLDQALMFYLFSILKSWHTEYEIVENKFGKTHVLANSEKCESLQKCLEIINKISCKKDLADNLSTLFQHGEINFQNLTTVTLNQYCYEVYLFILDLLKHVSVEHTYWKEYLLLKFLQTYQRVTKPKQTELDLYCVKESFPEIGYYRLPFQSLISTDLWSNLKTDITLSTYPRWLSVAGLLALGEVNLQVRHDMIYSNAVRQSMTSEKNVDNTKHKWSLHMKNGHRLNLAYKCISSITNLEWAGACFYYVYQGSLFGADQVAAADLCYQFAEHWAKVQPNNNVVKKMQSKHLITSTVHILHKIGLPEEKLLALSDSPQRLIEALYNHDCILTPYTCPDINNAVAEIAEKNGLNVSCIRMSILDKFLNINVQSAQVGNHNKPHSEDGTLNRNMLMKACYILKGNDQMMTAYYLSRIALDGSESLESYSSKIRALQCLMSSVNSHVIEKVTNYSIIDLWSKLNDLYFTNSLHLIGLEFLTAIFLDNKEQALQQIWHAREHNVSKVSFIIKMLIIYSFPTDETFTNELLKVMLKLDMLSEIQEFLNHMRPSHANNYLEAWSKMLVTPFKRLDTILTSNQKEDCFNTLKLLPTCPVLSLLDLTPVWSSCLQVGAPEMSVLVLPHICREERKMLIKKMGKMQTSKIQEIKNLKSKGILTTGTVMHILKQEYSKSK